MGPGRIRRARCAANSRDHASRTDAGDGVHRTADAGVNRPHDREDGLPMSRVTRRQALAAGGALAAARAATAQQVVAEAAGRIPPLAELLNAEEIRAVAERKLDPITFAEVGGSERNALERITFRPRLMIDSRQIDLSSQLSGDTLLT